MAVLLHAVRLGSCQAGVAARPRCARIAGSRHTHTPYTATTHSNHATTRTPHARGCQQTSVARHGCRLRCTSPRFCPDSTCRGGIMCSRRDLAPVLHGPPCCHDLSRNSANPRETVRNPVLSHGLSWQEPLAVELGMGAWRSRRCLA